MNSEEDVTEDTTDINWECYDGTDDSVITITEIPEDPRSEPRESLTLRRKRKLREGLLRERDDSRE
jgi:hypothetical protein